MSDVPTHGAYYAPYRTTIWQRLGFGTCSVLRTDDPNPEEGWAPGWFIVTTRAHLDWKDRIRALISGNLMIDCAVKTDVLISRSEASSAISILPPGSLNQKE